MRFVVVDLEGRDHEVTPETFAECPVFSKDDGHYRMLKQFVSNELGHKSPSKGVPKHIEYMRRHELVDYCEVSEKGHYKWYPNGLMIQKLLLDYTANLASEWGAFEMRNPLLIRGDSNAVGQLMGEFHERDYKVDGGRGVPPMFPLWLSPTQVRFIPVSDEYMEMAEGLCAQLIKAQIRTDIDDRGDTVGKKVRNGERDWIPYLAIIGEEEKLSGMLSVRSRKDKTQIRMTMEELISLVRGETDGMPFRPLPMPRMLSWRPMFYG